MTVWAGVYGGEIVAREAVRRQKRRAPLLKREIIPLKRCKARFHIRAARERDARQLHHLRAELRVDVRDLRHAPVYQRRAPLLLGGVVGAKPLQRAAGAGEELSVIGHSKALSQILSRRESSPSKSEGRLPRWAALPGALFARWRLSFSSISRGVNSPFSFHERIILFI